MIVVSQRKTECFIVGGAKITVNNKEGQLEIFITAPRSMSVTRLNPAKPAKLEK